MALLCLLRRSLRLWKKLIVLSSHPLQVKITFLSIAQTYPNGKSVFSALVKPNSADIDPATTIAYYDDHCYATISTQLEAKFFAGIEKYDETRAKLQGYVTITAGTGGSSKIDVDFHVDLEMATVTPVPSLEPSAIPSESLPPTDFPSLSPSGFLKGLPPHVEVVGMYCSLLSVYKTQ